MRISDQYVWNFLFALFFASLVISGGIILDSEAARPLGEITFMDVVLLGLATLRLTRLMVYDKITAFFREQFWDVVELKTKRYLEKPKNGPRRTMADLFSCPWCIGMWAGATVTFFYYLTPYAWFPIVVLAISGLGSFLQLFTNMVGWKAEEAKHDAEG